VKATNFLPLLRVTLNDSDKRLQAAARTAIATIEHAVPDDKARTSE
jgi:hypothetical protein